MFDGLRLAKVHLHPLGGVLPRDNLAVVAVLRAFLYFATFTKAAQLLVEVG